MAILDKIKLDFQVIDTGNPEVLAIMDTSVWGAIEDKVAAIEIVIPGSKVSKRYSFIKNKINIFNTSNLQLTSAGVYKNLPDGIYKVDLIGAHGNCQHRDFLKTDKARLEMSDLYIDLKFEKSKESTSAKTKIYDVDLLIRSAKALTSIGRLKEAMSHFKEAVKRIKEYKECKTC